MAYKFLIVDDSSIVRQVILKTLSMTGLEYHAPLEAENGSQALELLESNWVDLIFLDINMPVMNGMEFMKNLREKPAIKDTPVIIISTEGSKDRRDKLEALGIKAYLRKPTKPEDISKAVLDALKV